MKKIPESVTYLADEAGIDGNYLRRKWRLWFKYNPMRYLKLYWTYTHLFHNIEGKLENTAFYLHNSDKEKMIKNYTY